MGPCFLDDLGQQKIATYDSAGGVQQHQTRCTVVKLKRSKRLQRKLEAALRKNGSFQAALEAQAQEAVAPYAVRIRRAGCAESSW